MGARGDQGRSGQGSGPRGSGGPPRRRGAASGRRRPSGDGSGPKGPAGGKSGGRRPPAGGKPGRGRHGGDRRTSGKPTIPEDVPRVPRGVWRDIDASTSHGLAPEVARAVSGAAQVAEEEPQRASALLSWAKEVAPRSAAVREALGVHAYRSGDYETAARELQAYRRISGRQDQNHVLADSLRGTGRTDRIRELVEAMGEDVAPERRLEASMVHAGALADAGDVLRAREILERAGGEPAVAGAAHLRLWYMAAELSVQLGDRRHAAELLEAVLTMDPDFLDAGEWLGELTGEPHRPGGEAGDGVPESPGGEAAGPGDPDAP